MKKIVLLLSIIFGLSYVAYAGEGGDLDVRSSLPINGALCIAIGILYRQLIKVNDRLFTVIDDQHNAIKDMTEALRALQDKK